MNKLTVLLLLFAQITYAQTNIVLETINKISFDQDTVKSVFVWVTDNIKYDVNKLNAIKEGSKSNKNSNFKTEEAYKEHLLQKVIKQKKGVCQDYSLLFDAILKELGYQTYIIRGYTKNSKGKINRSLGHVWNVVYVDGEWKLYDPTWGAGYVEDGKRFVKKYKEEWYDIDPKEMLKTHMPFDPMWQLLEQPISYNDFDYNKESNTENGNYNFETLIKTHATNDKKIQMQDQVSRSTALGNGIRLIEKWRRKMTKSIGLYGIVSQQDLLEEATDSSNKAIELFNSYGAAKNKQFKGKRWTVEEAKQNLRLSEEEIQSALAVYKSIEVEDRKATISLERAIRQSEKLINSINNEWRFLKNVKLN